MSRDGGWAPRLAWRPAARRAVRRTVGAWCLVEVAAGTRVAQTVRHQQALALEKNDAKCKDAILEQRFRESMDKDGEISKAQLDSEDGFWLRWKNDLLHPDRHIVCNCKEREGVLCDLNGGNFYWRGKNAGDGGRRYDRGLLEDATNKPEEQGVNSGTFICAKDGPSCRACAKFVKEQAQGNQTVSNEFIKEFLGKADSHKNDKSYQDWRKECPTVKESAAAAAKIKEQAAVNKHLSQPVPNKQKLVLNEQPGQGANPTTLGPNSKQPEQVVKNKPNQGGNQDGPCMFMIGDWCVSTRIFILACIVLIVIVICLVAFIWMSVFKPPPVAERKASVSLTTSSTPGARDLTVDQDAGLRTRDELSEMIPFRSGESVRTGDSQRFSAGASSYAASYQVALQTVGSRILDALTQRSRRSILRDDAAGNMQEDASQSSLWSGDRGEREPSAHVGGYEESRTGTRSVKFHVADDDDDVRDRDHGRVDLRSKCSRINDRAGLQPPVASRRTAASGSSPKSSRLDLDRDQSADVGSRRSPREQGSRRSPHEERDPSAEVGSRRSPREASEQRSRRSPREEWQDRAAGAEVGSHRSPRDVSSSRSPRESRPEVTSGSRRPRGGSPPKDTLPSLRRPFGSDDPTQDTLGRGSLSSESEESLVEDPAYEEF